jgi:HK97 family phage prohead protease
VKDRRVISGGVELRSVEGRGLLVGRPVVYDSWSEPIGGMFRERILPGAFDEWLAGEPDVIACVNHDPARLLGRTASGTVRLVNDKQGLSVEVDPPATTYAADLAESVKRGDIRGMSFVFECTEDRWGSGRAARRATCCGPASTKSLTSRFPPTRRRRRPCDRCKST